MREQEMRLRVFKFLKTRMRNMVMPATIGIGLAVGGCSDSKGVIAVYSAPILSDASAYEDAALNQDTAKPDVPSAPETNTEVSSAPDVPAVRDVASPDVIADSKDDASFDGGIIDTQTEAGQVIAKYTAPVPDGAIDSIGPAPRYMAIAPDASPDRSVTTLYMAQLPS